MPSETLDLIAKSQSSLLIPTYKLTLREELQQEHRILQQKLFALQQELITIKQQTTTIQSSTALLDNQAKTAETADLYFSNILIKNTEEEIGLLQQNINIVEKELSILSNIFIVRCFKRFIGLITEGRLTMPARAPVLDDQVEKLQAIRNKFDLGGENQTKLLAAQEQLMIKTGEVQDLQAQLQATQAELKTAEVEIIAAKSGMLEAQEDLKNVKLEIQKLQQQVDLDTLEIQKLQQQLGLKTLEIQKLQQQVDLEIQAKNQFQHLLDLKVAEIETLTDNFEQTLQAKADENAEITMRLNEYKKQLEIANQEVKQLKNKIIDNRKHFNKLQLEKDQNQRSKFEGLRQGLEDITNKKNRVDAQLAASKEDIAAKLETKQSEIDSLNKSIASLEKKLLVSDDDNEKLKTEIANLNQLIENSKLLKAELEKANRAEVELNRQLQEVNATEVELIKQLEEAKQSEIEKSKQLEEELSELKLVLGVNLDQILALKQQLEDERLLSKGLLNNINKEGESMPTVVQDFMNNIEAIIAGSAGLSDDDKQNIADSLKSLIEAEFMKDFKNGLVAAELEVANKTIADQKVKLDTANETIEDQKVKLDTANETIEDQKVKLETANETIEDQKVKLETANETIEDQKVKLATANETIEDQKVKLDTANETIEDQKVKLETADETIEDQKVKLETANETIADQKVKLDTANDTIAKKEAELELANFILTGKEDYTLDRIKYEFSCDDDDATEFKKHAFTLLWSNPNSSIRSGSKFKGWNISKYGAPKNWPDSTEIVEICSEMKKFDLHKIPSVESKLRPVAP